MKTIDEYVVRGLANENLELLLNRIIALHLNLDLLINGIPQSAAITKNTNVDKIKEKISTLVETNNIEIRSLEITSNFEIKIKYIYEKNGKEMEWSDTLSIKEAEDCGIEINYI
jgi:hypothetical protein